MIKINFWIKITIYLSVLKVSFPHIIERFRICFCFFIIPANVTLDKMIGEIQIDSLKTQTDYSYLLHSKVCKNNLYCKAVIPFPNKALFYKIVVLYWFNFNTKYLYTQYNIKVNCGTVPFTKGYIKALYKYTNRLTHITFLD